MNPEAVLNDYRNFYLSLSDDVFEKRCKNFHTVGLKLHVVKEKLAFEAYKSFCIRSHVDISFGLKDAVNFKSRSSVCVIDLIESTRLNDCKRVHKVE